jgi:hypothetical protein
MWLRAVTRRLGDRGSPSIDYRKTREHDMNRYAITEKAGRFVAGQTNTGVGTVLKLTDKQAEHELRLGTLRRLDVPGSESEGGKTAPASKARKVAKSDPKPATDEDVGEGAGDE